MPLFILQPKTDDHITIFTSLEYIPFSFFSLCLLCCALLVQDMARTKITSGSKKVSEVVPGNSPPKTKGESSSHAPKIKAGKESITAAGSSPLVLPNLSAATTNMESGPSSGSKGIPDMNRTPPRDVSKVSTAPSESTVALTVPLQTPASRTRSKVSGSGVKVSAKKGKKRSEFLPSKEAPSAKKSKVPSSCSSSSDALADVPDPDTVPSVDSSDSKDESSHDLDDLIPSEEKDDSSHGDTDPSDPDPEDFVLASVDELAKAKGKQPLVFPSLVKSKVPYK